MSPEQTEEVIEAIAEPYSTGKKVAEQFGLKDHQAKDLTDLLKAKHHPISTELRKVKTGDLVAVIEDRMSRLMDHLDEDKMKAANVNSLAVAFGILTDKRQLLRGEPTSIIGHEDRLKLTELVPELIAEMKKRGMEVGEGLQFSEADGPIIDMPPQDPVKQSRPRVFRSGADQVKSRRNKISEEFGEPTTASVE